MIYLQAVSMGSFIVGAGKRCSAGVIDSDSSVVRDPASSSTMLKAHFAEVAMPALKLRQILQGYAGRASESRLQDDKKAPVLYSTPRAEHRK